jgi:hypothetical protein
MVPSEQENVKRFVVPTLAAVQSPAKDFDGGLKVTEPVTVIPAGTSKHFSLSLLAPAIPVFQRICAVDGAVAAPAGGQQTILTILKLEAQGLKTEFVTVQIPPNAPTMSDAETDTIESDCAS